MAEIYLKTVNLDKITTGQTYGHRIKPCFRCCWTWSLPFISDPFPPSWVRFAPGLCPGAGVDLWGHRRSALVPGRGRGDGDKWGGFDNFLFVLCVFLALQPQVLITVVHERVQLDKRLVAHLAVVRPLSFVQVYVQPDVRWSHEGAAADAAFEVLWATVGLADSCCGPWLGWLCRLVRDEERRSAEPLATLVTLVQPLVRVLTNVCQEAGLLRERLVAVGALEGLLTRVEAAVSLQVWRPAKGLTAIWTFEGPVPAVNHLVCHQVSRLLEVLPTGATPEPPLLVRGEVKGQMCWGDEGFGAQAAAVRVQADASVPTLTIGLAAARRTSKGTSCFGRGLRFRTGRWVGWLGVRVRPRQAESASAVRAAASVLRFTTHFIQHGADYKQTVEEALALWLIWKTKNPSCHHTHVKGDSLCDVLRESIHPNAKRMKQTNTQWSQNCNHAQNSLIRTYSHPIAAESTCVTHKLPGFRGGNPRTSAKSTYFTGNIPDIEIPETVSVLVHGDVRGEAAAETPRTGRK